MLPKLLAYEPQFSDRKLSLRTVGVIKRINVERIELFKRTARWCARILRPRARTRLRPLADSSSDRPPRRAVHAISGRNASIPRCTGWTGLTEGHKPMAVGHGARSVPCVVRPGHGH